MSHITCLDSAAVVSDFLNDIDYILTDCDGVLYVDKHAIPGTDQVIRKLRNMGKKVLFVTNNGTISRKTAHNKLNSMGFDAEFTDVFTTSFIVAQYLKMKEFRGTVYVLGENGLVDELNDAGIRNIGVGYDPFPEGAPDKLVPDVPQDDDIKAVVVGYDHFVSLPKLVKICTYARQVAPDFFLATNGDERQPSPYEGQLWPETGPFISFVETAVGRRPLVFGKPNTSMWSVIRSVFPDIDPQRTVMLGDTLETDIAFGNNNSLRYTVLIGTGNDKLNDAVNISSDPVKQHLIPTHYLSALSHLNSYLT